MLRLALIVLLANLVFLAGTLPLLPEPVAVHFDGQGQPDGWMSRTTHVLFMALFVVLMMGLFLALPALTRGRGSRWLSIPKREQWLTPANRPRLDALLADFGHRCAVLMGAFLLALQALLVDANQAHPPRLDNALTIGLMAAFVALLLAASLQLVWQLRDPDRR